MIDSIDSRLYSLETIKESKVAWVCEWFFHWKLKSRIQRTYNSSNPSMNMYPKVLSFLVSRPWRSFTLFILGKLFFSAWTILSEVTHLIICFSPPPFNPSVYMKVISSGAEMISLDTYLHPYLFTSQDYRFSFVKQKVVKMIVYPDSSWWNRCDVFGVFLVWNIRFA